MAKSNEIPSEVFFWGTTGTTIKPEPERINLFSGLNILQVAGGAGYSLALKDLVNEDNTNVKHVEGLFSYNNNNNNNNNHNNNN